MRNVEILANFEREINKIDDSVNKPKTEDSLFWLNQAVVKFMKLRFNGDFVHKTSYEQNEKRREDLISLYASKIYNSFDISHNVDYDEYAVEYPEDFLYVLNEDVVIEASSGGYKTNTCVFECTQDSFMYRVNNSLTDFHYKYHKARPIRVRDTHGCKLLTDKNYKIDSYTLGYLRKPNKITLDNPRSEYKEFKDNIMYEIIKIAAQMYIENQSEDRYKTITNEVLTQE